MVEQALPRAVPRRAPAVAVRGFALAVLCGLGLYLPLLSIQWDPNGIIEARAIEQGGAALFEANHMLYRPLAFAFLQAGRAFGVQPPAPQLYQLLSAVIAALGLGLVFLAAFTLTREVRAAALATALAGTAWAFWTFSTDIYYIPLAAALVSACLILVLGPSRGLGRMLAAGALAALSVLAWQADIFVVPALMLLLVARTAPGPRGARLVPAFVFAASALVTLALVFLSVGLGVLHLAGVPELWSWLTAHSSDAQGRPAFWGKWSLERVRPLAVSAVASFIPIWEGLGISRLRQGILAPDMLLKLASPVALAALVGWTAVRAWPRLRALWPALFLLIGYAAFLPFNLWWDPFEPKWFVVPDLFAVLTLAAVWAARFARHDHIAAGACIALLALANLTGSILPRHTEPNPQFTLASCVAGQLGPADTFATTEWGWFDYARYFYSQQGEVISLIGPTSPADKLTELTTARDAAIARGGHLYMRDLAAASPETRALAQDLTGLTPEALRPLPAVPAFVCEGQAFVQIVAH